MSRKFQHTDTIFECKLGKIAIDAGFAIIKVFIDIQSQSKKLGIFFYFPFFSDRPTLQILKKIRAPGN